MKTIEFTPDEIIALRLKVNEVVMDMESCGDDMDNIPQYEMMTHLLKKLR